MVSVDFLNTLASAEKIDNDTLNQILQPVRHTGWCMIVHDKFIFIVYYIC